MPWRVTDLRVAVLQCAAACTLSRLLALFDWLWCKPGHYVVSAAQLVHDLRRTRIRALLRSSAIDRQKPGKSQLPTVL
jgi:hypothetical protein